jgi:hypothetical protein
MFLQCRAPAMYGLLFELSLACLHALTCRAVFDDLIDTNLDAMTNRILTAVVNTGAIDGDSQNRHTQLSVSLGDDDGPSLFS